MAEHVWVLTHDDSAGVIGVARDAKTLVPLVKNVEWSKWIGDAFISSYANGGRYYIVKEQLR